MNGIKKWKSKVQGIINQGNYPYEVVNCGMHGFDYLHHGLFAEKIGITSGLSGKNQQMRLLPNIIEQ